MKSSLADISLSSPVHQILLSHGGLDRIPLTRTKKIETGFSGKYTLWTDELITNLLKSRFDDSVLEAYKKIKPLAYKADLARYCIVYEFGGWYFDLLVDVQNHAALNNFNSDTNFIFFRETNVPPFGSIYSAANTLFWAKEPRNQILENVISSCVSNILNEKYLNHPFAVTGPMVFGREITKYQLKMDDHRFLMGDCQIIDSEVTHLFSSSELANPIVFSKRSASGLDLESELPSGYESYPNNYYNMWYDRNIYN